MQLAHSTQPINNMGLYFPGAGQARSVRPTKAERRAPKREAYARQQEAERQALERVAAERAATRAAFVQRMQAGKAHKAILRRGVRRASDVVVKLK